MAFGDVIRESAVGGPFLNNMGLAFDGKYLYTILWNAPGQLQQIDIVDLQWVRTIVNYGGARFGMAFDGYRLWVNTYGGVGSNIDQVDRITGAVLRTIASPLANPTIYHDGKVLWVTSLAANVFCLVDPLTGSIERGPIALPTNGAGQIASDGKNFYVPDQDNDEIVQFDPLTGAEIDRGATVDRPNGLVCDGKYLYVGSTTVDRISQISLT